MCHSLTIFHKARTKLREALEPNDDPTRRFKPGLWPGRERGRGKFTEYSESALENENTATVIGSLAWADDLAQQFLAKLTEYGYCAVVAMENTDPIAKTADFWRGGNCPYVTQVGLHSCAVESCHSKHRSENA